MRALTVRPGMPGSGAMSTLPEPDPGEGRVLIAARSVGVCGTDLEILAGAYGQAPRGEERLVLGHESLGEVLEAPGDSGLTRGDLVVGIVRRPDPVPCSSCAVGEFDMCRNGRYLEHGIKALHGFARERWRADPDAVVRLDADLAEVGVLLEPASVVTKAWEHIEHIGNRSHWAPQRALITGAGPIGLLAALLGVQRGYDVHVLDRVDRGPKPELVAGLGATYHRALATTRSLAPDVVIECTGAAQVIAGVMREGGRNAIVCLTGVSTPGRPVCLDVGALGREWVLQNDVVFGSVNANRRHYETAAAVLARADRSWLGGMLTRRVAVEEYEHALDRQGGDVKTVLAF